MTSEGTDVLILALTLKTGHSVVQHTQNIIILIFCQKEDIEIF